MSSEIRKGTSFQRSVLIFFVLTGMASICYFSAS